MNNNVRSIVLLAVMTLAVAGLWACGDNEPKERTAFIEFLNKYHPEGKRVSIVTLNEETRKNLGRYADHYDVITSFHDNGNKLIEPWGQTMNELVSAVDFADFKPVIEKLQQAKVDVIKASEDLDAEYKKSLTQKEALNQPDDLKAVYDRVYKQTVSTPAEGFSKQMAPAFVEYIDAQIKFFEYVEANRKKVEAKGSAFTIIDPKINEEFTAALNEFNDATKKFNDAQQAFMKAVGM